MMAPRLLIITDVACFALTAFQDDEKRTKLCHRLCRCSVWCCNEPKWCAIHQQVCCSIIFSRCSEVEEEAPTWVAFHFENEILVPVMPCF
jgi:hypothetical protein